MEAPGSDMLLGQRGGDQVEFNRRSCAMRECEFLASGAELLPLFSGFCLGFG